MVDHVKKQNSLEKLNPKGDSNYWLYSEQDIDEKIAQGLTAFLPLDDPFLSISSRLHLISKAQHHIDLQYYIWESDELGHLLLSELLKAAERGVCVRLLIDDQNGTQLDSSLKQLSTHPNFSIKIFNPYKFRNLRILDFSYRALQINRRMHNKLIIADGEIAVTGGRNISRQYFDASDKSEFTDFDILFYGPAVIDANQLFLSFWNDELSHSVEKILKLGSAAGLQQLKNKYELESLVKTTDQQKLFHAEKMLREYHLASRPMRWAKAHFIGDTPNKTRNQATKDELLYTKFSKIMGMPTHNFQLVSAYFVPTNFGVKRLVNMKESHVDIRILTNSYLANNVPVVHAFYQKYRRKLLTSGVKLYEFKPFIQQKKRTWYEVATGNVIPAKNKNTSCLHAKFFYIDQKVFIGSFNFDPRSTSLNTEVGLVIESESLQQEIHESLSELLPRIAYELRLNEHGEMIWIEQRDNGTVVIHKHEPETTFFQRLMIKLTSFLPIEWIM